MKIKNKAEWQKSGKPLSEFLNIDDLVDIDIFELIWNAEPPSIWNEKLLQMCEPEIIKNGKPYYLTIEERGGYWVYTGLKRRPSNYNFVRAIEAV